MAKVKVANNPTQEEAASNLIRGENYNAIAEKLKLDINLDKDVTEKILSSIESLLKELEYKTNYISDLEDKLINKGKSTTIKHVNVPRATATPDKMVKMKAKNGAIVYLTPQAYEQYGHLYTPIKS